MTAGKRSLVRLLREDKLLVEEAWEAIERLKVQTQISPADLARIRRLAERAAEWRQVWDAAVIVFEATEEEMIDRLKVEYQSF